MTRKRALHGGGGVSLGSKGDFLMESRGAPQGREVFLRRYVPKGRVKL